MDRGLAEAIERDEDPLRLADLELEQGVELGRPHPRRRADGVCERRGVYRMADARIVGRSLELLSAWPGACAGS